MSADTEETQNETPKKTMSLSQFKSWLEGVEEMQEADWHPSATQWKTIRDKFDLIVEPKPEPVSARAPAPVPAGPMPVYQPPRPAAAPAWDNPPAMPEAEMTPAARALLAGGAGPGAKTVTPDVDTTDGNFESPFT